MANMKEALRAMMNEYDYDTFRLALEEALDEAETREQKMQEEKRRVEQEKAKKMARLNEIMSNAVSGSMAAGDIAYIFKLYMRQFGVDIDPTVLDYLIDADSIGEIVNEIMNVGKTMSALTKSSGSKIKTSDVIQLCKEAEHRDMTEAEMDQQIRSFLNKIM